MDKKKRDWVEAKLFATLLKSQLVEMANANDALMDGTMAPVLQLVAENEVVFAVWQDEAEPNGVGVMIVKGANKLRDVVATGKERSHRVTAIKCIEAEQAEALRLHVGADRTH
jgi:hypothetical protein